MRLSVRSGLALLLAASVAACSAMIPVRISGSLEAPAATFGVDPAKPEEFKRYGSARTLYNFHVDHASAY